MPDWDVLVNSWEVQHLLEAGWLHLWSFYTNKTAGIDY